MIDDTRNEQLLELRQRAADMAIEQLEASIAKGESPGRIAGTAVRLVSALNRTLVVDVDPADDDDAPSS